MSADATGSLVGTIARAGFSVLLIACAAVMMFKGVQFLRVNETVTSFHPRLWRNPEAAANPANVLAARDEIAPWRETMGVRDIARTSYFDLGRRLMEPMPATSLQEGTAVLAADPLRGMTWVDLAIKLALLRAPNMLPLAFEAWELSSAAVPYERREMLHRASFLLAVWPAASDLQKQRLFREMILLLPLGGSIRAEWREKLAALPKEWSAQVEREFTEYLPSYRRVR